MILRNVSSGRDLSSTVDCAGSPLARAAGWLGAARIAPLEGKWLRPCSAIHTLGMRSAIDVIFLDAQSQVVAIHPFVSPNRLWLGHRGAKSVLEMGPGFLAETAVAVGDRLALIEPLAVVREEAVS